MRYCVIPRSTVLKFEPVQVSCEMRPRQEAWPGTQGLVVCLLERKFGITFLIETHKTKPKCYWKLPRARPIPGGKGLLEPCYGAEAHNR